MINVVSFAGLNIAVFGLGISGVTAALALQKSNAKVWAWDDSYNAREKAAVKGVNLVNLYQCDWSKVGTLLLSPGVPFHYPRPSEIVSNAEEANCEIIGDIEILGRTQNEARYVGITGTNGKSTTTALIGHILKKTGCEVETGGNLGVAALALKPLGARGIYVLEMSSYQLNLTKTINLSRAILLNLTPDHLERHGGMSGYIEAKKLIFSRQSPGSIAIIGVDDPNTYKIFTGLTSLSDRHIIPISIKDAIRRGIYVKNGILVDDVYGEKKPVCDLKKVQGLRGKHNWQNIAAAYAATRSFGISIENILDAIHKFKGLRHRQELVTKIGRVLFINDSKATNPVSTAHALKCYNNIYWIAGGQAKEGSLDPIIASVQNIRHAFLFGEAARYINFNLKDLISSRICADLKEAIHIAYKQVIKDKGEDAVVLLSPACASFDQFSNFEERGETFKKLVFKLKNESGSIDRGVI